MLPAIQFGIPFTYQINKKYITCKDVLWIAKKC